MDRPDQTSAVISVCGVTPTKPGKYTGKRWRLWPIIRHPDYVVWKRRMRAYDKAYRLWLRCAKTVARTAPGATTPGADIAESLEGPLSDALDVLGGLLPGGEGIDLSDLLGGGADAPPPPPEEDEGYDTATLVVGGVSAATLLALIAVLATR